MPRTAEQDEDPMSLRYRLKVRILKTRRGNLLWRRWRARRGDVVGSYADLADYVRRFAPGHSFVDIGCMWGVNGAHSFAAEEAGARRVYAVDVFGPTPEFTAEHTRRNSRVEFILGDASAPATLDRIGAVEVVFCAGVLYHHPSPFDLLVAMRRICAETLILRTSTIPEVDGLPNAAVFFPQLGESARQLWNLRSLGVQHQAGITDAFQAAEGYGNWFWGLTPSCLVSLLTAAGFALVRRDTEPFAQTVVCRAVAAPFAHRLPGEDEARQVAEAVSAARVARPA
jgi:2-polyprenyl-3-methyl-5-hydroxy-6-metoxy-1,4-benzoquinol methylase